MLKYAEECPQFKLRKTTGVINASKLRRDQLMMIIDKALKYPEMVQTLFELFFSSDFPIPTGPSHLDSVTWDGPYKSVGKINLGWVANWILNRYQAQGLTKETLSAIDREDKELIMDMFTCELQVMKTCALPACIGNDPGAASRAFSMRADSQGRRIARLIEKADLKRAKVDFLKGGVYELEWPDQNIAVSVTHCASAEKSSWQIM